MKFLIITRKSCIAVASLLIFCSCNNSKVTLSESSEKTSPDTVAIKTPKKVKIRGVITRKNSYGDIPELGSTVYLVDTSKLYVDTSFKYSAINDTLLERWNWIYYTHTRNWLDLTRKAGVHNEAEYVKAMTKAIHDSYRIAHEGLKYTISSTGEFSFEVPEGVYYLTAETSTGTGGHWGRIIVAYGDVDINQSLYSVR